MIDTVATHEDLSERRRRIDWAERAYPKLTHYRRPER
jgi:hypothetical protein